MLDDGWNDDLAAFTLDALVRVVLVDSKEPAVVFEVDAKNCCQSGRPAADTRKENARTHSGPEHD
jgi:hypothetical protein